MAFALLEPTKTRYLISSTLAVASKPGRTVRDGLDGGDAESGSLQRHVAPNLSGRRCGCGRWWRILGRVVRQAPRLIANVPDDLVSNAAVPLETATIAESDPLKWNGDVDINLKGTYPQWHAPTSTCTPPRGEGAASSASQAILPGYIPGLSST